jgi:endonuclease-3
MTPARKSPKRPSRGGLGAKFPIAEVLGRVEEENKKFKRETLHAVDDINRDPFRVLIACLLSLRTRDPQTLKACEQLFPVASTPKELLALGEERIAELIRPVGFYERKASQIIGICQTIEEKHVGETPRTMEELCAMKGVGRKTANLTISLGFGLPGICVDTHVHRICNRWGYVATKKPDDTEMRLREILPPEFWHPINDLLVVFGQNVCLPRGPKCSECPLTDVCRRVGVASPR